MRCAGGVEGSWSPPCAPAAAWARPPSSTCSEPDMELELDGDQLELQRSVREVVAREVTPALLRSVIAGGTDAEGLWKTFVGLDWPLLTVPEADGGIGLSAVELAITLEELGYGA